MVVAYGVCEVWSAGVFVLQKAQVVLHASHPFKVNDTE